MTRTTTTRTSATIAMVRVFTGSPPLLSQTACRLPVRRRLRTTCSGGRHVPGPDLRSARHPEPSAPTSGGVPQRGLPGVRPGARRDRATAGRLGSERTKPPGERHTEGSVALGVRCEATRSGRTRGQRPRRSTCTVLSRCLRSSTIAAAPQVEQRKPTLHKEARYSSSESSLCAPQCSHSTRTQSSVHTSGRMCADLVMSWGMEQTRCPDDQARTNRHLLLWRFTVERLCARAAQQPGIRTSAKRCALPMAPRSMPARSGILHTSESGTRADRKQPRVPLSLGCLLLLCRPRSPLAWTTDATEGAPAPRHGATVTACPAAG